MEEQLINILKEMNEKIKDISEKIFLLQREPKVEHFYNKSKDGKYIIHSTKLVDIKPISYIEKVLTPQETKVEIKHIGVISKPTQVEFTQKDGGKVKFNATEIMPKVTEERVE